MIYLIILPILGFVLGLVLINLNKKLHNYLVVIVSLISLLIVLYLYFAPTQQLKMYLTANYSVFLKTTRFNTVILFFANLFGLLVGLYSFKDSKKKLFYLYMLLLLAFSNLVLLSFDFISFIFGWAGILVILFLLLAMDNWEAARKALVILGFSDFALILGVSLFCYLNKSLLLDTTNKLLLDSPLSWYTFILLLIGALAKAGSLPFHTWIPTAAQHSKAETMAILPASLDKLLGIYLLGKICMDFFVLNRFAYVILTIIGSATIIFAVLMALIQHDLRKLLSFHAISQVGYMVLGFGIGNNLGIIGGIFHMINNAIYKSGLFLVGGYVGGKAKTFQLDQLGGLAKFFPISFISALVFSLSISGIPPFNGFASKWIIYQAVFLELSSKKGLLNTLYAFSLLAAMFGSALTLASFIKFISGIFFGQQKQFLEEKKEGLSIYIPALVLTSFCIILGILPNVFVKNFIADNLNLSFANLGVYQSMGILLLVLFSIILGIITWKFLNFKIKYDKNLFVGSETTPQEFGFPAVEYYKSLEYISPTDLVYKILQKQVLDFYNVILKVSKVISWLLFVFVDRVIYHLTTYLGLLILGLSWILRKMHSGILDTYLDWIFFGMIILGIFFNLLK